MEKNVLFDDVALIFLNNISINIPRVIRLFLATIYFQYTVHILFQLLIVPIINKVHHHEVSG